MVSENSPSVWRKCSSCKTSIGFQSRYYVCSVSTCNGQRTGYVFCSVPCFERHLPGARHKDAAAIEERSPSATSTPKAMTSSTPTGIIRKTASGTVSVPVTATGPAPRTPTGTWTGSEKSAGPREVLVIASRLKEYIAAKSEYSTSASVMDVLSDHLRVLADRAIDNARAEGRKTVMDRDFSFLKSLK